MLLVVAVVVVVVMVGRSKGVVLLPLLLVRQVRFGRGRATGRV